MGTAGLGRFGGVDGIGRRRGAGIGRGDRGRRTAGVGRREEGGVQLA